MDYIIEEKIQTYHQSKIDNQIDLESYINECVILAENENIVKRLSSFNEADGGNGWEKIKGAFKKFGQFIASIFGKFFNRLEHFCSSNQSWLDKHKATILNNKPKFENVTTYNYAVGIKRMIDAKIPMFMDYETKMKTILSNDKDAYTWMASELKISNYKYIENEEFSGVCSSWFKGGSDTIVIDGDKLNMADIFNYCYNYDKMRKNIQNDQKAINDSISAILKQVEEVQKTIEGEKKNQQEEENNNNGEHENNNERPTLTPPSNQSNSGSSQSSSGSSQSSSSSSQSSSGSSQTSVNNSTVFSSVYQTYITEDGPKFTSSNSDSKNNVNQKPGTVGSKDNTAAANSEKNLNYGNKEADAVKADNAEHVSKISSADEMETFVSGVNRYKAAASAAVSAKLSVAEKCYKDYMRILMYHVDSYTGKDKENDRTTQIATNYSNGKKGNSNSEETQDNTSNSGEANTPTT